MKIHLQALSLLCVIGLIASCSPKVKVSDSGQSLVLENALVKLELDQLSRSYRIYDKVNQILTVDSALIAVDQYQLSHPSYKIDWSASKIQNEFGQGRVLLVVGLSDDLPDILAAFTLHSDQSFVELQVGLRNNTREVIRVKELYAMQNGQLYPESNLTDDFAMVDGFSGGEPLEYGRRMYSPLTRRNALKSRNNILLTFNDRGTRHTLMMGGLTYQDYEKFAWIEQSRRIELESGSDGIPSLLTYLNLPDDTLDVSPAGEELKLVRGKMKRNWQYHEFHCSETSTTAFDPERIVVELNNLQADQKYYVGFSWWRSLWHGNRKDHKQSVYIEVENDQGRHYIPLFENQVIPRFDGVEKEQAHQIEFELPEEAVQAGRVRFVVQHGDGDGDGGQVDQNVYLSEIWLRSGDGKPMFPDSFVSVDSVTLPRKSYTGQLFAKDPVGKRVKPGATYRCPDRFYISVGESDPFVALEEYGKRVKMAQGIDLSMYDFPTVCLWYAEVPGYGGGYAENSTVGAVNEMEVIKQSGFLDYSRAAVRLVPDSYLPNNQQGWWDDEHWQKQETDRNVSHNGRYIEPYETSEKWGKAVVDLGGIPLTYFQTAYRSEDYAAAFPEHMLFNKRYAWKGEAQDTAGPIFTEWRQTWTRNGRVVWGYDYSDPGFIEHLEEVYANLKKGGIKGLMFDYPASGWARQGGLERRDWTTAQAYRNIFKLPSEGLGPGSYVHERNMERGTDVSIGLVASMRTENDTDKMDGATVTRCGLRWYKNRILYNQDTDSKNLVRLEGNPDQVRAVLTMAYVTTGRLLLANSFAQMSPETIYDLTRTFPYHTTNQSARPIDAFVSEIPQVYDYEVHEDWHQVTFYNPDFEQENTVGIDLSGQAVEGALELDDNETYHVFDFWNDVYVGLLAGHERLEQILRPGEARMLSVRKKENHPQVISTNRHIMQGYNDIIDLSWNSRTKELSGTCNVVAGDPFIVTIANNGFIPESGELNTKYDLTILILESSENEVIDWVVSFKDK